MTLTPEQDRIISNGKALLPQWRTAQEAYGLNRFEINRIELETIIAVLSLLDELAGAKAENERLVKLVCAVPPAVIEPEIEKLLLRLETPTREDVANGTTVVYTPKPDVLWVCAAYRRLRARSDELAKGAETAERLYRHKKRGSTYRLICNACVQSSEPIVEGDWLAIYQGLNHDGTYWARPIDEFEDGRFEPILPVSSNQGAKTE